MSGAQVIQRIRHMRKREPMSAEVEGALSSCGLRDEYDARPAYQRNDYLLWINTAKRPETKKKRLDQMLRELEAGVVYMVMRWAPAKHSR